MVPVAQNHLQELRGVQPLSHTCVVNNAIPNVVQLHVQMHALFSTPVLPIANAQKWSGSRPSCRARALEKAASPASVSREGILHKKPFAHHLAVDLCPPNTLEGGLPRLKTSYILDHPPQARRTPAERTKARAALVAPAAAGRLRQSSNRRASNHRSDCPINAVESHATRFPRSHRDPRLCVVCQEKGLPKKGDQSPEARS